MLSFYFQIWFVRVLLYSELGNSMAAKYVGATFIICRRFPSTLANLSKMDVLIKDNYANITANMKLLNAVMFLFFFISFPWM